MDRWRGGRGVVVVVSIKMFPGTCNVIFSVLFTVETLVCNEGSGDLRE